MAGGWRAGAGGGLAGWLARVACYKFAFALTILARASRLPDLSGWLAWSGLACLAWAGWLAWRGGGLAAIARRAGQTGASDAPVSGKGKGAGRPRKPQ